MKQGCTVVADTNIAGSRITTIQMQVWLPLWPEVMSYRKCARNAASARALPFSVNLTRVLRDPFIPDFIGKEHKGMSPTEFYEGAELEEVQDNLKELAFKTVSFCNELHTQGVAKSILNRYLAPFLTINAIITGSQDFWRHFIAQRTAPDAEPNMQQLAQLIKKAYGESTPTPKFCHLPYVTEQEINEHSPLNAGKLCAARCARVSYTPFGEIKTDAEKDLTLAAKLEQSRHLSPFEHAIYHPLLAEVMDLDWLYGGNAISKTVVTYRQLLEGENQL